MCKPTKWQSQSVIFDEDSLWDWEKQVLQHISVPMSVKENTRINEMESEITTSPTQDSEFGNASSTTEMVSSSSTSSNIDYQSLTLMKLRDLT